MITMKSMSIETLWAPWRLAYIQGRESVTKPPTPEPMQWRAGAAHDCFLCRAAATLRAHDRTLGVLDRTACSVVIINRFPYANGHLLVAPLDHQATLAGLSSAQLLDLQTCLARWCNSIERSMQAQGFNIGLNIGIAAGAGLPGHLHWHIVPRWIGDVNFMPTVASTRVLPQSLDSLWEQLSATVGSPAPAENQNASHNKFP